MNLEYKQSLITRLENTVSRWLRPRFNRNIDFLSSDHLYEHHTVYVIIKFQTNTFLKIIKKIYNTNGFGAVCERITVLTF